MLKEDMIEGALYYVECECDTEYIYLFIYSKNNYREITAYSSYYDYSCDEFLHNGSFFITIDSDIKILREATREETKLFIDKSDGKYNDALYKPSDNIICNYEIC
jgi:hypothetical protein